MNLTRAWKAARQALEGTYTGLATVIEYKAVKDPVTKITKMKEVTTLENHPCKLSFETLTATASTDTVAAMTQGVKLFVSPDVTIPAGSKIVVTQCGVTTEYASSSLPAVYPTHQEIILKLFDSWA